MLGTLVRRPNIFAFVHYPINERRFPVQHVCGKVKYLGTSTDGVQDHSSPRLRLREYQEECVQSILTAIREGRRHIGVSLATGSGKTVIFTELIDRVPAPSLNSTQTLVLVHRRELVEQAARHCKLRYPDKTVDIEMGSMRASGSADVTIASVQSINSRDRIHKFDPHSFKLVLVDEAHHIVASGYLKVLEYFGLQSDQTAMTPTLVGVSATMSRFDGLALGKAIKYIVYHKDFRDMINEKFLADVIFTTVKSTADVSKVKKASNGDFQNGSLSKAVNTAKVNEITVRAWKDRAGERESTLVFCVDLAHVDNLTRTFRMHGIDARFVTGSTPKQIRSERLDAFRSRDFPVLLNCGVFTEGTDIPNIDCVLLARPTKSKNLLMQMIGRGMRLYPGKNNCHVIDMVASLEGGIATTPTLFGLDPTEIISGANMEDMRNMKEKREVEKLDENREAQVQRSSAVVQRDAVGKLTFTHYASVNDLVDDTSSEQYIRAISQNSWVHVGDDRYILTNGSAGSYLTIERSPSPTSFSVSVTNRIPTTPKGPPLFAKPRVIANSNTFESAVRGADTYASNRFTHIFISKNPPGNWRNRPASDAQVAFLNKYRGEDEHLTSEDITKGKAGDMITKIRFGAKGRFNRVTRELRRIEKRDKWVRQQKHEEVKIGPLGS